MIESLTSAAPGSTVVVGVDDVHLLDDLSIFVLHQIVQRGAAKVMLTVRDGEPIPAGIQEVWRAGQFDRLDLQPLSRDETTMLVSATLGGSVDPDAAQRLWELTRGNVLYLRNIVEQEVGDGRLVQLHGFWRWIGEPVVPPGLVELIESRIGALPTSVSDVIDALAVGEPIELGSLTRITDRGSGRGGRHAWPDRARPRRRRRGGAGGASALRRGAQEARGTHQAAAVAGTRRR